MSFLAWPFFVLYLTTWKDVQAVEIQDFFVKGVSSTGQIYPRNVIDATNGQATVELHYAFTLDPVEKLTNASIYINDEEAIKIWYNITTPVAFPPFQGFGRDMGWKYNKSGAGVIVISYPMPFLHGRYRLEVNALNMDTQETWITRKMIYVKYFSNCTRLDGTAQIISPCTFDLKLKCHHPVFPLSNFKALMYLTSTSDKTFAKIIPVDAVTLRERDDDRYDATVAFQHQLSKYAPLDLVFRSELYQEDRIENSINQPLIKGASCNGEGSPPDPTAYQFLVPVTFYPTQTAFTAETFDTITKPVTLKLPDNSSSTSIPLSMTTSMKNDAVSESNGSSAGTCVTSRPIFINTFVLCFVLAHLAANRAQV